MGNIRTGIAIDRLLNDYYKPPAVQVLAASLLPQSRPGFFISEESNYTTQHLHKAKGIFESF